MRSRVVIQILFLFICVSFKGYANDREVWVNNLNKIAYPVIYNLANGELRQKMPVYNGNVEYQYLEAFGRVICGIAPWIELGPSNSKEGQLREEYINLIKKSFSNGFNTGSPDYLNFDDGIQPLVDAAYLAQGLIRSPKWIWGQLDEKTKEKVIQKLKSTRRIQPLNNNFLLFASMIEAFLLKYDGDCNNKRLYEGINTFYESWYVGDGIYSDGSHFSVDYYNGYVIHPMLTDILGVISDFGDNVSSETITKYRVQLRRLSRYAEIQERLISPDGYYPIIGRTLICRMGVFHALGTAVLYDDLSENITNGQVRGALTEVLKNQMKLEGNFDENGFLTVGFSGNQPSMAETYVSSGSAYHCCNFFLPLGVPESGRFWTDKRNDWTSKKAWSGVDFEADHAYVEKRNVTVILLNSLLHSISFKYKVIAILFSIFVLILIIFFTRFIMLKYYTVERKK